MFVYMCVTDQLLLSEVVRHHVFPFQFESHSPQESSLCLRFSDTLNQHHYTQSFHITENLAL